MTAAPRVRWAVVGVGIAGRARAAAITADPRGELVGVHRGRFAAETGAPQLSLAEAIATADAVAVCSPTDQHVAHVRAALEGDCHVVVEFPIAPGSADAEALFALAAARERVLHVEHIELLSPTTTALAGAFTRVLGGQIHHRAAAKVAPAGAQLGPLLVPRLHRLGAVAGPILGVTYVGAGPGWLACSVLLADGVEVSVRVEAGPGIERASSMTLRTDTGAWEQRNRQLLHEGRPQDLPASMGLFAQDQLRATARILDGAPPYVSDEEVLRILRLVERIAPGRADLRRR